jgi:isopenicillin N synthase-like dioxygenase
MIERCEANASSVHQGYYVGREVPASEIGFLRGPNQWPAHLPENEFRKPVMEYWEHTVQLCHTLLEILVIGLGHNPSVLTNFTKDPVANLKLLHYPPHPELEEGEERERQFGAAPHTDFGTLPAPDFQNHSIPTNHFPKARSPSSSNNPNNPTLRKTA